MIRAGGRFGAIVATVTLAACTGQGGTDAVRATEGARQSADGRPTSQHPATTAPLGSRNGALLFVSDRRGGLQIFSMGAGGADVVRVTHDRSLDSWPVWSPDRTQIAFASTRNGKADVFVMPSAGGAAVRLTTSAADDYHPTWSPDGRRIAFESTRDGNAEIYVMNADGSGQVRLTDAPGLDGSPAWSPDGSAIAFERDQGGNEDIYTIRPDGSGLRRLTTADGEDTDPAWSPDGSTIAFTSGRLGSPRLFAMANTGSAQVPISPPAASADDGGGTGIWMDSAPAWSPDGAWIAFATTRSGSLQIRAMPTEGGTAFTLTDSGNNGSPAWR